MGLLKQFSSTNGAVSMGMFCSSSNNSNELGDMLCCQMFISLCPEKANVSSIKELQPISLIVFIVNARPILSLADLECDSKLVSDSDHAFVHGTQILSAPNEVRYWTQIFLRLNPKCSWELFAEYQRSVLCENPLVRFVDLEVSSRCQQM
ncbi:hypothetical protein Nepgr_003350 [Nepenthes gracilis]|uniref:Uncharacterized protein n=1 Tax=Nepenthes gracilis TaxID=150966 RepID=A0AAD3RZC6_NEPGR|nr:hypothetical protein Nepgr_003350 [Nepenthes gracilis]